MTAKSKSLQSLFYLHHWNSLCRSQGGFAWQIFRNTKYLSRKTKILTLLEDKMWSIPGWWNDLKILNKAHLGFIQLTLVHGHSKWPGRLDFGPTTSADNHLRLNLVSWAIPKNCPSYSANILFSVHERQENFLLYLLPFLFHSVAIVSIVQWNQMKPGFWGR